MTEVHASPIPVQPAGARPRLDAIDLLRGAVMIIMALDHTRDFVSREALIFEPTDLTQTNAALFLTRWITHFCAPVFCFLAGTGAFLSFDRGKTKADLARFLLSRGAWLVLLELTVVQFGWTFRLDPSALGGGVIWSLGWSMIVLAALIFLPVRAVGVIGILMIAGHNLCDHIRPEAFGSWSWLWTFLHVMGPIPLGRGATFFIAYPLVPWAGVMAAGYAFGSLLKRERAQRRRLLLLLGIALTLLFVIVRALNVYGDPQPWSAQKSGWFTLFSFLNCAKYPPSLLFLLMTLGPAIIALALFDRALDRWAQPLIVFGRVPLFFYLLHLPLIHAVAVILAYLKHGYAGGVWYGPAPFDAAVAALYPQGYGYGLGGVYALWLAMVLLLYPLCRWFAELKQRRRDAWLSYF